MVQAKAKIFLADERGLDETGWFRSQHTFSFGKYQEGYKQPVGDLYILNDDILDGGRSLTMRAEEPSYVILLPVIGAISFTGPDDNEGLLAAGQAAFLAMETACTLQIKNPFKDELVNYIQLWIRAPRPEIEAMPVVSTFDVNKFQNCLMKISPQRMREELLPYSFSLGKFSGRGETSYYPRNPAAGSFVFVLEGAFEVAGRLMHARDGLALYDLDLIEMEALSNGAIMMLIDLPVSSPVV
ncbi:MAG: hypothetical protein U0U70_13445 [Chitinophagaceae bacterium]